MNENQADWRLNPITERDLLEDHRQRGRRRLSGALLAMALITMCPVACIGPCVAGSVAGGSWAVAALTLPLGFLGLAGWKYNRETERDRERQAALRREFGDVDGWIVELAVFQGDAVSGRDVGVLWFEDGRLLFTGIRTSFGLGVEDTQRKVVEGWAVNPVDIHLSVPLRAKTEVGGVSLGFTFLSPPSGTLDANLGAPGFRYAADSWFREGDPTSGQLPPLAPGPGRPSLSTLRNRAVAATIVGPLGLVAVGVLMFSWQPMLLPILVLVGLVLALFPAVVYPRRCWRELRDGRRLDGLEWKT